MVQHMTKWLSVCPADAAGTLQILLGAELARLDESGPFMASSPAGAAPADHRLAQGCRQFTDVDRHRGQGSQGRRGVVRPATR